MTNLILILPSFTARSYAAKAATNAAAAAQGKVSFAQNTSYV